MNKENILASRKDFRISKGNHILRVILLLLLLIILCLLTFLILIYTENSSKSMQQKLCHKIQVATEQTCSNIDYRFEQVIEGASSLLGTIYPYLNNDSDKAEQVEEYAEICRTMNEYIDKHMISFLRLYVPDTKIYANQISMSYSFYKLEDIPGGTEELTKGGVFWQPTHSVKLGDGTFYDVLTCCVAVKRLSDYEELAGVLCADVDVRQFYEIFASGTSDYEHMYLVDENGIILAKGDMDGQEQTLLSEDTMKQIKIKENGYLINSDSIYAFNKLQTADWYVISTDNLERAYTMDVSVVRTIIMVWAAVFLILLMVIVAMVYSTNLTKTVRGINMAIQLLDAEQEDIHLKKERPKNRINTLRDRISHIRVSSLEHDVEDIILSINGIVEGRYKDKLAISEYRMESLQAQIKPHFLYNTLDAIKWMIMDENSKDAVWMVNALSRYLRLSINKGDQIVSLEEEIKLMRIYFEIMQRRFRGKFETVYDLAEETLHFLIPKLSLQPLAENAILHGILHSEKTDLRLVVRSWQQDELFVIQIEDNGCGMKPEQASYLSNLDIQEGSGYGIANVHNRLDIFGCGSCRFEIESKENVGTCVTIELPILEQRDKKVDS